MQVNSYTYNVRSKVLYPGLLGIFFSFLVIYVSISFFYLPKYPTVYGDETLFSEPCVNFLKDFKFRTTFYSPIGGFEESNLIHGRIFYFFQVLIFKLFGVSVITMRLQSFLAGLSALFLTFLLSKKLFANVTEAVISTVILALSHLFIFTSHLGRPDMTVTLFILLAIYLLMQANQDRRGFYILSGAVASLAIDVHPPGNIALIILFGLTAQRYFSKQISLSDIGRMMLGVLIGLAWWFFFHVLIHPELFLSQRQVLKYAVSRPFLENPLSLIVSGIKRWYDFFWLGAYHRNMFLLFLISGGLILILIRIKERSHQSLGTLIMFGFIGLAVTAPNLTTWYIIYIYPFFCILISHFLWVNLFSNSSLLKSISKILLIGLFLFLFLENVEKLRFLRSSYDNYIEKIKLNISKDSIVLASDHCWLGLKDQARFYGNHVLHTRINFMNHPSSTQYHLADFDNFLLSKNIDYIIADQELIGWPSHKETLLPFIKKYCKLVGKFEDPFYGSSLYLAKRSPQPMITEIYQVIYPKYKK